MAVINRGHVHSNSFPSELFKRPNKRVLDYTKLESLARDERSSLLGPFISYEQVLSVVNTAPVSHDY